MYTCTATYFDFIFLYCYVLQPEMHVRLICAIKFYLLTYLRFLGQNAWQWKRTVWCSGIFCAYTWKAECISRRLRANRCVDTCKGVDTCTERKRVCVSTLMMGSKCPSAMSAAWVVALSSPRQCIASIPTSTSSFTWYPHERTPTHQYVLFFSRPRSEGWPHHQWTVSIYLCPLSLWLTLHARAVLSTSWCCPSRPCVVFLACVHQALFLALSLSPGNSLVSSWCDHSMLP